MTFKSKMHLPLRMSGALLLWGSLVSSALAEKKNVLFINVDDLRPQLGCYENSSFLHSKDLMKTPSMDALAKAGTVFERAYCQVPICGASRLSIFNASRPYKEPNQKWGRNWTYTSLLDKASKSEPAGLNHPGVTMIEHFKQHGYMTSSVGKVYHSKWDDKKSWDKLEKFPGATYKGIPAFEVGREQKNNDGAYVDGVTTDYVIDEIEVMKDKPFFFCVGMARPHLPFNCPKKYWDMYPVEDISLPNMEAPEGAPRQSLHKWYELRNYTGLKYKDDQEKMLEDEYAINLIRGYYACVSYVDAQIGKIIQKLKDTKDSEGQSLYDNTIIMIWGDHGFNLSEHNLWCKHANYNTSLQTALIVRAPGMGEGEHVSALVELIDMYPTLCDLTGVPYPKPVLDNDQQEFTLQGTSFLPLLENPNTPWKEAVFARYDYGDTVKTNKYIYTEYVNPSDKVIGRMLYDHEEDPHELKNIAELRPEVTKQLSELLGRGPIEKRNAWKKIIDGKTNVPLKGILSLKEY
jgi:iduronate 2-sulfatase